MTVEWSSLLTLEPVLSQDWRNPLANDYGSIYFQCSTLGRIGNAAILDERNIKPEAAMLVCSCNFITENEIRDTIRTFLDEDCWQLIVPGKIYHAMQKRGRCCGCFPTVVDLIVDTTREYHLERHTDVPEMAAHLDRLHAYHAQHVPQVRNRDKVA